MDHEIVYVIPCDSLSRRDGKMGNSAAAQIVCLLLHSNTCRKDFLGIFEGILKDFFWVLSTLIFNPKLT